MKVDLQLSPGSNDWPRLRDAVLAAEADGYDTTWLFDHFDGSVLGGDRPMLECFSLLGALAEATSSSGAGRIGLGTLVVNVANRHPAVMAAGATAVQRISGGRLRLGIGAGASPGSPWAREHRHRHMPLRPTMAERHAAVVEQLDVLHRTIAETVSPDSGALTPFPIIVGTNSVALSRIAGELADGLNVRMSHPDAASFIRAGREAAAGKSFEISGWTFLADGIDRAHEHAAALGLDRLILVDLGPIGEVAHR